MEPMPRDQNLMLIGRRTLEAGEKSPRSRVLRPETIATMGASYAFVFGTAVLLEFDSLVLAIWRQSRGKDQTRWRTISSTKELDRL
jgi:hypothetical protein